MNGVSNIAFLVKENNTPLAASFNLTGAVGFVSIYTVLLTISSNQLDSC
jgi:hypothetical protein